MAKHTIRILVAIFIIKIAGCQDGFSNEDLFRLQQYSINDGATETIHVPSMNSLNAQYHLTDKNNGDFIRSDRSRIRKVYRIKNPFQQHQEDDQTSQQNYVPIDSSTGASNQYPAMQYSLPPDDFLQKIKSENQYYQQQQLSTQMTALPYTATPQPQYQYSTIPASNYDQQSNQISTSEPKSYTPTYQSNSNSYQYNPYMYNVEGTQSTPIPSYLSSPIPNSQYIGTPVNTYVSSSSPIYLSSPQNFQQYVSSPMSNSQTGNVENNNRLSALGNNYERSNGFGKSMQIDHYDNSANGIKYPLHNQNQYQTDFVSSTISPNTSIYPEQLLNPWQTPISAALNALPKSEMYSQKNYPIFKYNNNQQSNQQDTHITDLSNTDTNRNGNIPAANNLYYNYAQPDFQVYNNVKNQARDLEHDTSQSDAYSHGDYGWKLSEKKSSLEPEISTKNNYFKYQIHSLQPETGAISQVNFQMDSSKTYGYDQNIKPVIEKIEPEEFVKAAAKAHENYKQQLEANKYFSTNYNGNLFYNNDNDKQRNKQYNDITEAVTANPFMYNQKEILDNGQKLPFDHEKALKNIVPIDVSNVVQSSDLSSKPSSDGDSSNKYSNFAYYKELADQAQAQKQFLRHAMDSYYKDRNTLYSIRSKPQDSSDKIKQFEHSYEKHQVPSHSQGSESGDKRYIDLTQSLNLAGQIGNNPYDHIQSPANSHLQSLALSQNADITNLLKFNDIPYRLTQSHNSELQRNRNSNYEQSNIPTPLPPRVNQNVQNHHIDVAAEILNKLMTHKQSNPSILRPEIDSASSSLLPTINGFKVSNPYNVDLKLVEDMLKGKPAVDDSRMTSLQSEIYKPLSTKFDVSQLQQLFQLKNDNNNGMALNSGLFSPFTNSFYDIYNGGRFPYQGVKYSRSEEEPENIPIADSSNNHPIGAVVEEDEGNTDLSDITETNEELNLSDNRYKNFYNSSHRSTNEKHKHPSITYSTRYSLKRKYPKLEFDEPYPVLKPPPPHNSRHRAVHKGDKMVHRRRVIKPKMLRIYKTEPLFEAGASLNDDMGPIKRSLSVKEEEVDIKDEKSV